MKIFIVDYVIGENDLERVCDSINVEYIFGVSVIC